MNKKKAEMGIYSAIFVLVLLTLFVPIFQYFNIYQESATIHDKIQMDTNSFMAQESINMFDSLKIKKIDNSGFDSTNFKTQLRTSLGLTDTNGVWTNGSKSYSISNIKITPLLTKNYCINVEYKLTIPIVILGKSWGTQTVDQAATAVLSTKYWNAFDTSIWDDDSTPESEFTWSGNTIVKYNGSRDRIIVPLKCTAIGANAFSGSNMSAIFISPNVVTIDKTAFNKAKSIQFNCGKISYTTIWFNTYTNRPASWIKNELNI